MSALEIPDINLRVLYDFAYKAKDDRQINIIEGEKLFLIKKTNADWWQVIRSSRERPFFVPAMYVEECSTRGVLPSEEESTRFDGTEPNGNDIPVPAPRENVLDNKRDRLPSDSDQVDSRGNDATRILRDRRKPWAVEELMFELARKHNIAPDQPEPEPEPDYEVPDYENIFRDEHGNIRVAIDSLDSDGNIVRPTSTDSVVHDFPLSKHPSLSVKGVADKIDLSSEPESGFMLRGDKTEVVDIDTGKEGLDLVHVVDKELCDKVVATPKVKNNRSRVSITLDLSSPSEVFYSDLERKNSDANENVNYSRVTLVSNGSSRSDEEEVKLRRGKRGTKVKQLSESLEKLAQQIQFKAGEQPRPSIEHSKEFLEKSAQFEPAKPYRPTELRQHSLEEITSTDFSFDPDDKLQTYPNKMMQKVKNKLNYSSSFKTAKELEKSQSVRLKPGVSDVRASVSGVLEERSMTLEVPVVHPVFEEAHQDVKKAEEKDNPVKRVGSIRDGTKVSPAVPGRKSSLNAHDVKGEANVLDKPKSERETKLQNIAIGFQNPMYSKVGHSLDNFNDPKVLALHDMLCTDLDEKHKSSKIEQENKKHSKKKRAEPHDIVDNKVRNFHKLKTTIESAHSGIPEITVEEPEVPVVSVKQQKERSASKSSLDEPTSSSNSSLNRFRPQADNERSRSDSNASDDAVLKGADGKRKTSLTRTKGVESMKERHQRPPSPSTLELPIRELSDGWGEYRTLDGRTYYYSCVTGDKSWKPPRRGHHSECEEGSPAATASISIPPGWRQSVDNESGETCYVHDTGAKWFSSCDAEGRLYFFAENSPSSSWSLPPIPGSPTSHDLVHPTVVIARPANPIANFTSLAEASRALNAEANRAFNIEGKQHNNFASLVTSVIEKKREEEGRKEGAARMRLGGEGKAARAAKALSMVIMTQPFEEKLSTPAAGHWPNLLNGDLKFVHEGVLHRTKITENGKKVRKNWNQSYVVLTELMLLFFNDIKHVEALRNGAPPQHIELSVELGGAHIERADKLSSRKNVYVITTQLGLQLLLAHDSSKTADIWFHKIQTAIQLLPRSENSPSYLKISPDEKRKGSGLSRSKSLKVKSPSIEDLTDEKQTKIRARLKKFFVRRPTKESLVKKGIYKDEPMFGRCLADVVTAGHSVPAFVIRCVEVIESKEENMKSDGLYRVSGNLSQVQKIRLQADQNNLMALEHEEDVHVLTGALKLFFRELKKPVIPFELFSKALNASALPDRKEKLKQFRDIVKALPAVNRSTLQYLLQHLLRVTTFKEFNRMHIPNIAIVFGPTLMWSEEEQSNNMAIDMMQQNFVIECLLQEYDTLFR